MKTKGLITLLAIICSHIGMAQNTLFARTNGNWNNANPTNGTWSTLSSGGTSCGCLPSNDDSVVIDGFDVVLPNNGSTKDLTIQNGGTLTVNNNSTLSVHNNGVVNLINGIVSHAGPTSNARIQFMTGNYSLNVQAGFSFDIDDLIIEDGVNLALIGTGNINVQNDLSFEGNGSVVTNNSNGHFSINRDLWFEPGFAFNLFINNGKLTINDDISLNGNSNKVSNNDSIILNDDVSFLSNLCELENSPSGIFLCDDDISFSNTTDNKVINKGFFLVRGQGVGGIVYEGQRDSIINQGTMHSLLHLKVQASHHDNNVFINKSGGTLNIDGEFDLNDADFRFENFGTFNLLGRLDEMGGNETIINGSGAVFNYFGSHNGNLNNEIALFSNFDANEFNYLGNSAQDVVVPIDAYWHLSFGGTNTKELQGSIVANGDLTISGSAILDVSTDNFSVTVSGNWSSSAVFNARSGQVVFNGQQIQSISAIGGLNFYDLVVNKNSNELNLFSAVSVANNLNLVNGALKLNSNTLTVLSLNTTAITRTNGYIISEQADNSGKLSRNIGANNGSYLFPFGTSTGDYIPFILESTSGDFGMVTVSTYRTGSDNLPWPTLPELVSNLNSVINASPDNRDNTIDRFWQIDKSGTSGQANLTFHYAQSEVTGNVSNSESLLQAQRYNSSTNIWEPALPNQVANATSNAVNVNNVSSFSPWTLAISTAALPITLFSFEAEYTNNQVELNWSTSSQINNDFFTLEKSADAERFHAISTVEGAGTNSNFIHYSDVDDDVLKGSTYYYRLKQTDFNGEFSYSEVVAVTIENEPNEPIVFPNPSTGQKIQFQFEGQSKAYTITIHDITGRICHHELKVIDEFNPSTIIYPAKALSNGSYVLKIQADQQVKTTRFLVSHP